MGTRRWVIFGVGVTVAAGLAVAALMFGLRGVEVAGWLAGVASLVVAVAAVVLAAPPRSSAPSSGPMASAGGAGSIHAGGDITGIASTGDDTTNIQHR
ncbi:hypothetical protein AB0I61_34790 [Polymorphospora rubra]|uniref:hypothetical protein n=1 Tax=Polymorphospora rubra TaxID=338584 RepID=UPI0033CB5FDF